MVWTLLQALFDCLALFALFGLWIKSKRPPQDDPLLSRGLQLLQSKITILEDLSDRTDTQVKQLTAILDQKTRSIHDKIVLAEQQMLKIDQSMQKSLEVAEIFQDRIPHEEVLERKRTIAYVRAAKMAHRGQSVEEITHQVDLPREQIELIYKFNKEQLMFDESALPSWAKAAAHEPATEPKVNALDFLNSLEPQTSDFHSLEKLEKTFKDTIRDYNTRQPKPSESSITTSETARSISETAQSLTQSLMASAANILNIQESPNEKPIRKVEFPRIQLPK